MQFTLPTLIIYIDKQLAHQAIDLSLDTRFFITISLIIWYIDFEMTTYISNRHVCKIKLIIFQRN